MKYLRVQEYFLSQKSKSKILLLLFFSQTVLASLPSSHPSDNIRYRTSFGSCPSRVVGNLTMSLVSEFEKNQSLFDVKKLIERDKLEEKHFVSEYKISHDPLLKQLSFSFDCPEPLMKVQVYKETGAESYEAVLVSNGKLFDPTYEVLLRADNKLSGQLPYLAIPVGDIDQSRQVIIADLINQMNPETKSKLSEVILSDTHELTIILSVLNRPSSVFLGLDGWQEKVEKLDKIVGYMESKKKIPAIINLTNAQKVVVKFND
jgi:hypothetical protein